MQKNWREQSYLQNITKTIVTSPQIHSKLFLGVHPRNVTHDFKFPIQSYFMINLFMKTQNDDNPYYARAISLTIPHINTT